MSSDTVIVRCFGDLIGEWDHRTDRVKIVGRLVNGSMPVSMSSYGQGFEMSHVRNMGEVTELNPWILTMTQGE
jgi:hypothetical protein